LSLGGVLVGGGGGREGGDYNKDREQFLFFRDPPSTASPVTKFRYTLDR